MRQATKVVVRIQSESGFTSWAVHGSVCRIGGADRGPASAQERFDTIRPDGKLYQAAEATDANKSENAAISGLQIAKTPLRFKAAIAGAS